MHPGTPRSLHQRSTAPAVLLALCLATTPGAAQLFDNYQPLESASDQFGAAVARLLDDEHIARMPGADDPVIFEHWKQGLLLESDERLVESAAHYETIAELLPTDAHAYWRVARNLWRKGESLPAADKVGREDYFSRSIEWAGRGIEADGTCAECMLWKFVSMGRLATTRGVLSAIRSVKEMSRLLERGISLEPTHADTSSNTTLGNLYYSGAVFYRILPDWFWIRLLIGVRGDMDRSLDYIRKAVAISPARVDYQVELAAVLLCLATEHEQEEHVNEAIQVLESAVAMDTLLSTDFLDIEHAGVLRTQPELACGYSRDGFIDVKGVIDSHQAKKQDGRSVSSAPPTTESGL